MHDDVNKPTPPKADATQAESKFYDFIAAAAHDLQAPLRKLSVLTDRVFLKYEDKFDHDAKEYINRIETCIGEMKLLVNGLMDLAKSDVITSLDEICDLDKIAKETLETMREDIAEKRALITMEPLPTVHGNIIQYRQLFKNLLENAIKFSKEDVAAKIEVKMAKTSEDEKDHFNLLHEKKYYKIQVSDNGIGFRQIYAEKIFEPFVRLHSRSEYEGNGLGLFICKKIIANCNGIIYAEGNQNEGARFILILPETPGDIC